GRWNSRVKTAWGTLLSVSPRLSKGRRRRTTHSALLAGPAWRPAMQALEGGGWTSSGSRWQTHGLAQNIGEVRRLAVLNGINKNPPPWSFGDHVDALYPAPCIGPRRFAVGDHQHLVDSRQRNKLRRKTIRL